MWIITKGRLNEWAAEYPDAAGALDAWYRVAKRAKWGNLVNVREDFPTADGVTVGSGRTVTVFNIRGNNYRLVAAIKYGPKIVYALRFMTHAEYDRGAWKRQL